MKFKIIKFLRNKYLNISKNSNIVRNYTKKNFFCNNFETFLQKLYKNFVKIYKYL